jgi:hypothetical protein
MIACWSQFGDVFSPHRHNDDDDHHHSLVKVDWRFRGANSLTHCTDVGGSTLLWKFGLIPVSETRTPFRHVTETWLSVSLLPGWCHHCNYSVLDNALTSSAFFSCCVVTANCESELCRMFITRLETHVWRTYFTLSFIKVLAEEYRKFWGKKKLLKYYKLPNMFPHC